MNSVASIIINNHNYGRYLAEAIDSALAQTFPRVEVIVVDDGSTDDSRDVMARYGGRIVPILQDNRGQAAACNAGLTASRGDVVCFLDADDTLFPTALARAALKLAAAEVVKVHWPLCVADRRGRLTTETIPDAVLAEGDLREDVIRDGPLQYVTAPTSGNAWSRAYLEKVFPIHEWGNKHGADAYLSMLAPLFGRVARLTEPQGTYRMHQDNFSGARRCRRRSPELFAAHCELLRARLAAMGVSADPEAWQERYHAWERDVARAAETVAKIIPPSARFILVDDNQLGPAFATGRESVPFLERGGEYWGPPPDDETAIRELQRLRNDGYGYLVQAWPAFWWSRHYAGFHRHLGQHCRCVMQNERLVVFELGPAAGNQIMKETMK